jgi:hypothetical protein
MGVPTHPDVEQAESLLRLMMPNPLSVVYTPEMPRRDGTPYRWFQVIFAVGPGDTPRLRNEVHLLFPRMLATLSQVRLVTDADVLSLRARRFCPDSNVLDPAHPVMFIEAEWAASVYFNMQNGGDFSKWARECLTYFNHFDRVDPLTRHYVGRVDR